jgi:hypothetical protein
MSNELQQTEEQRMPVPCCPCLCLCARPAHLGKGDVRAAGGHSVHPAPPPSTKQSSCNAGAPAPPRVTPLQRDRVGGHALARSKCWQAFVPETFAHSGLPVVVPR